MKPSARVFYFIVLSATAACLLLTVAHLAYSQRGHVEEPERLAVGGMFIAACALCISMTIHPNWLNRSWRHLVRKHVETGQQTLVRRYVAHHPDCDSFQSHRIAFGGIVFCSGCFGLMIGSTVSMAMMTVYLFLKPAFTDVGSSLAIAIGLSILFFIYLASLLQRGRPLVNTTANMCMVPGLCLLTIGMLEITGNLYAGLLAALFSFLWVDTRIQISQWRHSMTCELCPNVCKAYKYPH